MGLRSWLSFKLRYRGLRSELVAISGWILAVLLHSFLSFARRPICLSPVRDMSGLSCTGVVVSSLRGCIGHILVVMSWYSWMMVIA